MEMEMGVRNSRVGASDHIIRDIHHRSTNTYSYKYTHTHTNTLTHTLTQTD